MPALALAASAFALGPVEVLHVPQLQVGLVVEPPLPEEQVAEASFPSAVPLRLLCHAVHPILHVLPLEPRLWRRLSARLYHSVFTSPSSDSTSTVVICVGGGPFGGGPGLGGGPTGGLSSSECVTPGTTG